MAAKLYGQMAGVPIQTLQSGVALASASRLARESADHVLWRDQVAIPAGALVGDQVSLGIFRASAFLDTRGSVLFYDAFGAGVTLNIGDVNFPAGGRSSALSVAASGTFAMFTPPPAAQIVAPLWQRLGYAASPGGNIELLATWGGAAPAAGNLGWQIFGRNI